MALPKVFTKSLGAASSNNIAASQSASAGVSLTLNGSASVRLSTTSSAAAAVGATIIPLSSVTGVVVGNTISDSTATTAFVSGTIVTAVGTTSVSVWPPVSGAAGVGSGDTIVISGIATIDTSSANNNAVGRRIVVAYTGTDTSFTVVGTNGTGNVITDTIVGASGVGQSNLDFVTVVSITPVGGGLTGVTAGTNAVGSSPWTTLNWHATSSTNISVEVELVSGSATYTVEYTYDDPNNLLAGLTYPGALSTITPAALKGPASATGDGSFTVPIAAVRLTINTGTGVLRARVLQSSIG